MGRYQGQVVGLETWFLLCDIDFNQRPGLILADFMGSGLPKGKTESSSLLKVVRKAGAGSEPQHH